MSIRRIINCRTICHAISSLIICTIVILAAIVLWKTCSTKIPVNDFAHQLSSNCSDVPSSDHEFDDGDDESHRKILPDHHENHRAIFERFQRAIRYRTITMAPQNYRTEERQHFIDFLQKSFRRIHTSSRVTLEIINRFSLLYTIKGEDQSLRPYLLLAHYDVVPVQQDRWSLPAFDGAIKDAHIYGRGALDLKCAVMGILESLESLLADDTVKFERSFYIAIGHDEEGRGLDGALQISKYLSKKLLNKNNDNDNGTSATPTITTASSGNDDEEDAANRHPIEFILDEGPYIFRRTIPGIADDYDVAMIGVAEKGLVNVRLSTRNRANVGGHSSTPPHETAIVRIGRAVSQMTSTAHRNRFGDGPELDMIRVLTPYCTFWYRALYSNLWLFSPLVARLLERDPLMNSFVRTTTAVTVIRGGIKDNVIPAYAEAIVNHRIYPLESVSQVVAEDRRLIGDDGDDGELTGINVEILGVPIEPHPISPFPGRRNPDKGDDDDNEDDKNEESEDDTFGYRTIQKTIGQIFPRTIVVPGVMYAATDTRWFLDFTDAIYRFSPVTLTPEDRARVHGDDERISADAYLRLIRFYRRLMLNANRASLSASDCD